MIDVYVPVNANVTCVVEQLVTVNVPLTLLTVPLVCKGLNPETVIVDELVNGANGCVANVAVAVPPLTVNPVIVKFENVWQLAHVDP
jgi:hypothetical protein